MVIRSTRQPPRIRGFRNKRHQSQPLRMVFRISSGLRRCEGHTDQYWRLLGLQRLPRNALWASDL
jgi:hypothetical protein